MHEPAKNEQNTYIEEFLAVCMAYFIDVVRSELLPFISVYTYNVHDSFS